MPGKLITPSRRKELLDSLKAKGASLHGNRGANTGFLIHCVDAVTNVDDLLSVYELGLIPAKFGIVGIVLRPISNMIAIVKAMGGGHRLFEHKAISYTVTAWAFNHTPSPPFPPKRDLRSARRWKDGEEGERKYAQVWKAAEQRMLLGLKSKRQIKGKSLTPEAYKLLLRSMSNNDPMMLARSIWMSFENKYSSPQDRSEFKHYTEGILYPN